MIKTLDGWVRGKVGRGREVSVLDRMGKRQVFGRIVGINRCRLFTDKQVVIDSRNPLLWTRE